VWDVLSNDEVVSIVSRATSRASAARFLVESAHRAWRTRFPTSKIDDCAVVCLFLNTDEASKSSSSMPNNLANAVEVSSDQHSTTVQLGTGVSADLVTALVKDGKWGFCCRNSCKASHPHGSAEGWLRHKARHHHQVTVAAAGDWDLLRNQWFRHRVEATCTCCTCDFGIFGTEDIARRGVAACYFLCTQVWLGFAVLPCVRYSVSFASSSL